MVKIIASCQGYRWQYLGLGRGKLTKMIIKRWEEGPFDVIVLFAF